MDINSCFSLFPRNLKIIMKLTASISKFLKLMVIKNAFLFQDRGSAKKQERRVNKLKGKLSRKANDATSIKGRSATVSMEAEETMIESKRDKKYLTISTVGSVLKPVMHPHPR